jgi:hypothetical protein
MPLKRVNRGVLKMGYGLPDKKPARFTLSIQEGQDCSPNQFFFSFQFSVIIDKLRVMIAILSKSLIVALLYTYAAIDG